MFGEWYLFGKFEGFIVSRGSQVFVAVHDHQEYDAVIKCECRLSDKYNYKRHNEDIKI